MLSEARSVVQLFGKHVLHLQAQINALTEWLTAHPPVGVITIARGSSDHAAAFLSHLISTRLGLVCASLPLSVLTLYRAKLQVRGWLVIVISQSGRSPDTLLATKMLRDCGALTVAIVNDPESPLAEVAERTIWLDAGVETSVAATKTYLTSLFVGAQWVAHWTRNTTLNAALHELPERMLQASAVDWMATAKVLAEHDRLMVIGRGAAHTAAMEIALKLKETCGIQAEALSAAEVLHGPMALVEPGYAVVLVVDRSEGVDAVLLLAHRLAALGAVVTLIAPHGTPGAQCTYPPAGDPVLDILCAVQAFYGMCAQVARLRGRDPDHPVHLSKVTHTV